MVALGQACGGGQKRWYLSTLKLQLVPLELCRACRSVPTLPVHVRGKTGRSLWVSPKPKNEPDDCSSKEARDSSRAPVVRALRLTWELPLEVLVQSGGVETWR